MTMHCASLPCASCMLWYSDYFLCMWWMWMWHHCCLAIVRIAVMAASAAVAKGPRLTLSTFLPALCLGTKKCRSKHIKRPKPYPLQDDSKWCCFGPWRLDSFGWLGMLLVWPCASQLRLKSLKSNTIWAMIAGGAVAVLFRYLQEPGCRIENLKIFDHIQNLTNSGEKSSRCTTVMCCNTFIW